MPTYSSLQIRSASTCKSKPDKNTPVLDECDFRATNFQCLFRGSMLSDLRKILILRWRLFLVSLGLQIHRRLALPRGDFIKSCTESTLHQTGNYAF